MEKAKTVEINAEEYFALLERDDFLSALEEAGVDSWAGYDEAVKIFEEYDKNDENEG